MLKGGVFALQHAQEDGRDEDLDLRLQMGLDDKDCTNDEWTETAMLDNQSLQERRTDSPSGTIKEERSGPLPPQDLEPTEKRRPVDYWQGEMTHACIVPSDWGTDNPPAQLADTKKASEDCG